MDFSGAPLGTVSSSLERDQMSVLNYSIKM
jgi:hypothetical protein